MFYYRLNICDNELYTEEDDIQIIIDLFNNSKRVRRLIINNFDSKETNKRMNIIKISTTKWYYKYYCLYFICSNEKKLILFILLNEKATEKAKIKWK